MQLTEQTLGPCALDLPVKEPVWVVKEPVWVVKGLVLPMRRSKDRAMMMTMTFGVEQLLSGRTEVGISSLFDPNMSL